MFLAKTPSSQRSTALPFRLLGALRVPRIRAARLGRGQVPAVAGGRSGISVRNKANLAARPLAPNKANSAGAPGWASTLCAKSYGESDMQRTSAKQSQSAAGGSIMGAGRRGWPCRRRQAEACKTKPIWPSPAGTRGPVVQNKPNCPKRGTEAVSRSRPVASPVFHYSSAGCRCHRQARHPHAVARSWSPSPACRLGRLHL